VFVCQCQAVTDRTVRAAVASGARTLAEVAERCRAGSRCGGCWPELERLIAEGEAARSAQTASVA